MAVSLGLLSTLPHDHAPRRLCPFLDRRVLPQPPTALPEDTVKPWTACPSPATSLPGSSWDTPCARRGTIDPLGPPGGDCPRWWSNGRQGAGSKDRDLTHARSLRDI